MSTAQFIHVAQFYETILCFSILILIGHKILMIYKSLDQKYFKRRTREFNEQIKWEKSFIRQTQVISPQQQQQKRREQQIRRVQEERNKLDQELRQSRPPQQQNIRSSLVENNHDQTDRKMMQDQETPQRKSPERKSLTDLRKSQEILQRQVVEIRDQNAAKNNDYIEERRDSFTTQKRQNTQLQNQVRNKTGGLQGAELKSVDMQLQQPSIAPPHYEQNQYREYQKNMNYIKICEGIDSIFSQYLPILMSVVILGIMTQSTYIFTMICFFGYIFTALLINYVNLLSKQSNQPRQKPSIFAKSNKLFAGFFILAIFISYWVDSQFN